MEVVQDLVPFAPIENVEVRGLSEHREERIIGRWKDIQAVRQDCQARHEPVKEHNILLVKHGGRKGLRRERSEREPGNRATHPLELFVQPFHRGHQHQPPLVALGQPGQGLIIDRQRVFRGQTSHQHARPVKSLDRERGSLTRREYKVTPKDRGVVQQDRQGGTFSAVGIIAHQHVGLRLGIVLERILVQVQRGNREVVIALADPVID